MRWLWPRQDCRVNMLICRVQNVQKNLLINETVLITYSSIVFLFFYELSNWVKMHPRLHLSSHFSFLFTTGIDAVLDLKPDSISLDSLNQKNLMMQCEVSVLLWNVFCIIRNSAIIKTGTLSLTALGVCTQLAKFSRLVGTLLTLTWQFFPHTETV